MVKLVGGNTSKSAIGDPSKVNYADRARKLPNRLADRTYKNSDGEIVSIINPKESDRAAEERRALGNLMQKPINDLKYAQEQRDRHQRTLAQAADYRDKSIADAEKKLKKAQATYEDDIKNAHRFYDYEMDSSSKGLKNANSEIDKLLRRNKKEESLNEDFSDKLPEWAKKAIKGGKWNSDLKNRLKKQNIDLANAEVEIVDVSTLTSRGVKTGVDENGNVLLLNMAIPGRYSNGWEDKFAFIPGIYHDDYPVTNPRIDKQQQMKYMPAKDIISFVKDAIIIKPSNTLGKLKADRVKAKASSIDRGKGQYSDTNREGIVKWYQASRQDKSGYPIPDINDLFKKITYLTPDNYEERLAYADSKLNEVKNAVTNLLNNPNVIANLFTGKFGHFGDGILRELSGIEEDIIKVSKYLDDIKKTANGIIADGDDVEREFKWLNSDYTGLQRFRSDIREINNDINKLLAKITPEEVEVEETETIVEESLKEDYEAEYEWMGKQKGKERELAQFFADTLYHALDNIYNVAHDKIKDLPESNSSSENMKVDDAFNTLIDLLVEDYFGRI